MPTIGAAAFLGVRRTLARRDRGAWHILASMARQCLQGIGNMAYSDIFTLAKQA
jgi:hypothetical protein